MKTQMATEQIIKKWIQYLKNNQIAALKSDPKTGQLQYRRPVTIQDLESFLELNSNFSREVITKAIRSVIASDDSPKQVSAPPKLKQLGHDPNNIEDIDYREVPNKRLAAPITVSKDEKKPHYKLKPSQGTTKPRVAYKGLREEFKDNKSAGLSEKDIEKIFSILFSKQAPDVSKKSELTPDELNNKKNEDMNKLRRAIRDVMTPQQRRTLWRALNEV